MRKSKREAIRRQVDALGIPPKDMVKKEISRHERKEAYRRLARKLLTSVTVAAAIIIIITNLWITVLQIDGSSMNPLLHMDEIVLTVRTDRPQKGDVIAFYHENKLHVKRVIATENEKVDISAEGIVSVNNIVIDEPYVSEQSLGVCDIEFPYQVPPGSYFVLGDNRPLALDSREAAFGSVSRDRIVGKVAFRIWPFSKMGSVK